MYHLIDPPTRAGGPSPFMRRPGETTPLPPELEPAFRAWLQRNGVTDLDHPRSRYDYRGAFLAQLSRDPGSQHFPDTFKQHGHPTFSEESKYSSGPGDGGQWLGEKFAPPGSAVRLPEIMVAPDQPFARGLDQAAAINRRAIPEILRREGRGALAGLAQGATNLGTLPLDVLHAAKAAGGFNPVTGFNNPAQAEAAMAMPATTAVRDATREAVGLEEGQGEAGELFGNVVGDAAMTAGMGKFGSILHNYIYNPAPVPAPRGRVVGAQEAASVRGMGAKPAPQQKPLFRSAATMGYDKYGNEYPFEGAAHPMASHNVKQAGWTFTKGGVHGDMNDGFVAPDGTYYTRQEADAYLEDAAKGKKRPRARSEELHLDRSTMPSFDEQMQRAKALTEQSKKMGGIPVHELDARMDGATWDPRKRQFIDLMTEGNGYAVANPKGNRKIVADQLNADEIARAREANKELLKEPGMMLGWWKNPEGKWEIEVSQIFPDEASALKTASERGEKAIFGGGREIQVPAAEKPAVPDIAPPPARLSVAGMERLLNDLGVSPSELVDRLPPEMRTHQGLLGYTGPERRGPPRLTSMSPSEAVDALPPEMQTSRGLLSSYADDPNLKDQAFAAAASGKFPATPPPLDFQPAVLDMTSLKTGPTVLKDVPQVDLPRMQPRSTKLAATTRRLEKRIEERVRNSPEIRDAVARGVEENAAPWYIGDPIAEAFVNELGPDAGRAAFNRWADFVGATSTRSKVPSNLRAAGLFYHLEKQGQLPELSLLREATKRGGFERPAGFGHLAQSAQNKNIAGILEHGRLDPHNNPKPAAFAENIKGNFRPLTADAHFSRMVGVRTPGGKLADAPPKNRYAAIERAVQRVAEEQRASGLLPDIPGRAPTAPWQASLWVGGADETGVMSGTRALPEIFDWRIQETARALGITPQQALKKFIRGEIPMLGLGGVGLMGTLQKEGQ